VREEDRAFYTDHSLCRPLLSIGMLWLLLKTLLLRPAVLFRVMRVLRRSQDRATFAKNLLVLPKGLWLAEVARQRNATHIHAQWAGANATIAMIAGMASGVPWSFTAHRGDIVQRNLLPEKCASAAFVRFISQSGVQLAAECGARDLDKACVIHLGVDVPDDVHDAAICHDPAVLLCPASVLPVKGHKHLIEAMALLAERQVACRLQIAGFMDDKRLCGELEALVERLSLGDRVRMLGFVPYQQLLAMYVQGEIDVVVLPSVDLGGGLHEGIPASLMEAMAHGLPVVSTRSGGIPELLFDGAGMMVPPADPVALADALQRLLADDVFRTTMARAGRQRVRGDFSAEATMGQFLRHIETTNRSWATLGSPAADAASR
jgi:glycosyltransferase involved in cell wall biosynthesis